MTIEQLNARMAGKTIVKVEKYGKVYDTDVFEYGDAKPDPANGKWCYVRRQGEWMLYAYPVRVSLLEELAVQGIAVTHGSNVQEIEAHRRAGVFPLPEYTTRTAHYVVTR